MKTMFRNLTMAALVGAFAVTGVYAQDVCTEDAATAKYDAFVADYNIKNIEGLPKLKVALTTGKEFLEKYGACESWKDQVTFVKGHVPRIEKLVADMEEFLWLQPRFAKFDAAINADNAAELHSVGKEILTKKTDDLNIMLPMALIGQKEVAKELQKPADKRLTTYNADSLRYSKLVLDKLRAGAAATKKNPKGEEVFGVLKYEMSRENAISELLFNLAYINYYGQDNKKAAIPYYYEVTKAPGFRKDFNGVYATIAAYYTAERAPVGAEIQALLEKQKAAATDEDKVKVEEEIKPKVALFNGYTERIIDALGRAHKLTTGTDKASTDYKANLYKEMQAQYELRFDKKDGLDSWVTASTAKPLPDPTTPVMPVSDEKPADATTTTGGGSATPAAVVAKKPGK